MKVLKLTVKEFGGIEVFEAVLDGQHGLVRGPNGSGKTSALNALVFAMGGKVEDAIERPMRQGADICKVELALEGYTITRVIETGKAPKLVVRDAEDKKVAKAQTFLSSLVPSGLAFRPLDFGRYAPAKQRELLLAALDLNVDELDKAFDEAYEARRDLNRDLTSAEARLRGLDVPDGAPAEVVDTAELMKELEAIEQVAQDHASNAQAVEEARGDLRHADEYIGHLQEQLDAERTKRAATHERIEKLSAAAPPKPDLERRDGIRAAIAGAADQNRLVEKAAEAKRERERIKAVKEQVAIEQARMDAVKADKAKRLKEAEIVPGLEVRDAGLFVDGLPFGDLNTEQKLEVGIAVAVAQNPKLRTILIDNAESIDRPHWDALIRTAAKADLQIIAAEVERDGDQLTFEIVEAP